MTKKVSGAKPQLDGQVVSNNGNTAIVKYKDGESRAFERFLGQEELKVGDKVFREAKPADTQKEFLKELPIGALVRLDWRPEKWYGMTSTKSPNFTSRKMTVGDLTRELQVFPEDALALISVDEEGNRFKHLANVINGTFGNDEKDDDRYEDHGLKAGDPYVIIWPHG